MPDQTFRAERTLLAEGDGKNGIELPVSEISSGVLELFGVIAQKHPLVVFGGVMLLLVTGMLLIAKFLFDKLRADNEHRTRELILNSRRQQEELEFQQRITMLNKVFDVGASEGPQQVPDVIAEARRIELPDRRVLNDRRQATDRRTADLPFKVERRSGKDRRSGVGRREGEQSVVS